MRLSRTLFIRSLLLLTILINTSACSKDPYLESMAICEAPTTQAQEKLLHSLARQVDMNYFADSCEPLLKRLMTTDNQINIDFDTPDITILRGLTGIKTLLISENLALRDLDMFENFTRLSRLTLHANKNLEDISGISEMTSLKYLSIVDSNVSNIKPLKNLIHLTTLILPRNNINDISALENLTEIQTLNLSKNYFSDISPLTRLHKLESLYLRDNTRIKNISLLGEITTLKKLDFYQVPGLKENAIFFSKLVNLQELDATYGDIDDIRFVKTLKKLTRLKLSHNKITDISPVQQLENIEYLNLEHNNITDISVLRNMHTLKTLHISGNKITDFSPVSSLAMLKKVSFLRNPVRNCDLLKDTICKSCIYECNEAISYYDTMRKNSNIE